MAKKTPKTPTFQNAEVEIFENSLTRDIRKVYALIALDGSEEYLEFYENIESIPEGNTPTGRTVAIFERRGYAVVSQEPVKIRPF